jgi:hypothetical protein
MERYWNIAGNMSVIMGRMSRWDNMVVYPAVSQWSMDRALNTAGYTSEI